MRTMNVSTACMLAALVTPGLLGCASDSAPAKATESVAPTKANQQQRDASMTDPKMETVPSSDSCAIARKAIETRDFIGWRGLPNCVPSALFENFPTELGELPVRRLGSSKSSATFVMLNLDGYYRPMANVRDEKLVLVDGINPEIGDKLTDLLTELGTPEAKLDWTYGTLPFADREWVYPSRGITLFLNSDHDKALHVALYAATDLATYTSSLRPPLSKTPLPKR